MPYTFSSSRRLKFTFMVGWDGMRWPLDENDLWIAATALAMDAALVIRDSDFQAIGGLAVVEP
jgi:predicted nucleic acid-binding protein